VGMCSRCHARIRGTQKHMKILQTTNVLVFFCCMYLRYSVMQQNMYLTLLPSRPTLVNIGLAIYECHQNYSHQMPDFSFKMHQIQFRSGSSQSCPGPLAAFGEGKGKGRRRGGKVEGWEGKERGEEGKGEGKGREKEGRRG